MVQCIVIFLCVHMHDEAMFGNVFEHLNTFKNSVSHTHMHTHECMYAQMHTHTHASRCQMHFDKTIELVVLCFYSLYYTYINA